MLDVMLVRVLVHERWRESWCVTFLYVGRS